MPQGGGAAFAVYHSHMQGVFAGLNRGPGPAFSAKLLEDGLAVLGDGIGKLIGRRAAFCLQGNFHPAAHGQAVRQGAVSQGQGFHHGKIRRRAELRALPHRFHLEGVLAGLPGQIGAKIVFRFGFKQLLAIPEHGVAVQIRFFGVGGDVIVHHTSYGHTVYGKLQKHNIIRHSSG